MRLSYSRKRIEAARHSMHADQSFIWSILPASLAQSIEHVLVVLNAKEWKAALSNPPQRLRRNSASPLQRIARLLRPP
jgi:hypothetical protein